MAANEPSTTNVVLAYLLLRLPSGGNIVFNSKILEMRKYLFKKFTSTVLEGLSESASRCAMFLDILQTENDDKQPNWYPKQSLCLSKLDTWKAVRLEALVNLFRNESISLTKVMQLLEFTISQMLEVLFQKNIPLAWALFDWMIVSMRSAPIGLDGETIDGWLARNGGWKTSTSTTAEETEETASATASIAIARRILCIETEVITSALRKNAESKPEGPVHCKSCKGVLSAPFGSLKEQCKCGQWVCLKESCYVSYSLERILTQHISDYHIQKANLDECLHCGNFKDRSLNKCPVCGALWCVKGNCRYETRNKRGMGVHEQQCGKNKTETEVVRGAPERSTQSTPEGPHCRSCKRALSAPLGILKRQCECGRWVCLKESCYASFYLDNGLTKHISRIHIRNAKLDQCLHCGNSKDRSLKECPVCGASWCIRGKCTFETRDRNGMYHHEAVCGKSKRKNQVTDNCLQPNLQQKTGPTTSLMDQALEQSGIDTLSPQPSLKEADTSPHTTTCEACKRLIQTPLGAIRQKCVCGKFICSIKDCGAAKSTSPGLSLHHWNHHFYTSRLDECVHCGNFKSRRFNECVNCHALWCTIGDCRFETHTLHSMKKHKKTCNGTNETYRKKHRTLPL